MDKFKLLEIDVLRLKIAKELYEDTFKNESGPGWLTLPTEVRDGFLKMVAVMFDSMFKEDPTALTEFFVDERLTMEEVDLIIVQARQQGKTMRQMQQQNAFVQRAALFSLAEDMLRIARDFVEEPPETLGEQDAAGGQLDVFEAALAEIKDAADPAKMRKAARIVQLGDVGQGSTILGPDGKPMTGFD